MSHANAATYRPLQLRWILAVSIVLNGFLLGWIGTTHFAADPPRRGMLSAELRVLGERLPDAEREALRMTVRKLLPELRQEWRRLRELRREINDIAARPQPDRAAVDARLAEIRKITAEMQARVQSKLFDDVLALPPQTRARLAHEN